MTGAFRFPEKLALLFERGRQLSKHWGNSAYSAMRKQDEFEQSGEEMMKFKAGSAKR